MGDYVTLHLQVPGARQDEPHEAEDRAAAEGRPEHLRHAHHLQRDRHEVCCVIRDREYRVRERKRERRERHPTLQRRDGDTLQVPEGVREETRREARTDVSVHQSRRW